MPYCLNHPDEIAPHKCIVCGKPLCPNCILRTEIGICCGETCKEKGEFFIKKKPGALKKEFKKLNFFKHKVSLFFSTVVPLGIIYVVLIFVFDTSDPLTILSKSWEWMMGFFK